jgi:hypothetical protein
VSRREKRGARILRPIGKLPAEVRAVRPEWQGPERRSVAWQRVRGQTSPMQRLYPGWRKSLNAPNKAQNRLAPSNKPAA